MVPADSAVEIVHSGGALRHGYTLAELPSIALLPACLRGEKHVFACVCAYLCVFLLGVKGQQNKPPSFSSAYINLLYLLRVNLTRTVKTAEFHWMN